MKLDHLPFFRNFSPLLRKALVNAGSVELYSPRDLIFSAGDNETDFYLLIGGRIRISKISTGGQKKVLRTVRPGDTFALVSLFDHLPMFISAEVIGDQAQVFVIPRDLFLQLLKTHHELSLFVISGLVSRIRRYGEAMTSLSVYETDQRFISYLLELMKSEKGVQVLLPDTVKTIAEQLGTVREVLSREISKMLKNGWIRKEGRMIEILDLPALKKRIQDSN